MDRLDIGDILMNKNKEKIFKGMLLNTLLVDITEIDLATIENNDYKLYNKNIYILLKTELKELTKTAVEAFNAEFDSKHLMLKFKENSMDYRLLPSEQNKQIHLTLHTKVSEFEYLQFSLQYNPQDILINFPNNQRRCCACCIII